MSLFVPFTTEGDGWAHTQRSLIETNAQDLQALLSNGLLTSVQLVEVSLAQIEAFDHKGPKVHAMISVVPRDILLSQARLLDAERKEGKTRGPLHGLPIVVKDIIDTDPSWGISTTQGSKVLEHVKNAKEAKLITKLRDAGLIVIGKANLSEFGAGKGESGVGGLSALGGQARSVYVSGEIKKGDKGLSNTTGSALAVAAGYTPLSIGGESDGSLTTPASRSALYALKISPQTISRDGIFQVVPTFETVGGIAKSVRDVADITQVILQAPDTPREVDVVLQKDWKDISIGFVDPPTWRLPDFLFDSDEAYLTEIKSAIEGSIAQIRSGGGTVHYPVNVKHVSEINFKGQPGYLKVLCGEFRDSVNSYLAGLVETPVRTLAEIIAWNKEHPEDQAGIDQAYFITTENDTTPPDELNEARAFVKQAAGAENLFRIMDEFKLDAIAAPTDGPICTVAAMAGSPTACVPLGYLSSCGRPFGLSFIARPGREDVLLRLMSAWEAAFPARQLPPVLLRAIEQDGGGKL